jgi:hypothetical protein
MSGILERLSENIVARDYQKEGAALVSKWENVGLLEGLKNEYQKNVMAVLLENQTKEFVRVTEATSMAAGDVEGFAGVAFPIVRRVFGGLLANDIVSVQPMKLPTSLIFFMDFKVENARHGLAGTESVYGGGVVGSQITGGVSDLTEEGGGFYNLQSGYSSPTASLQASIGSNPLASTQVSALSDAEKKLLRFDPDLLAETASYVAQYTFTKPSDFNEDNLIAIDVSTFTNAAGDPAIVRRLTSISGNTVTITVTDASNASGVTAITGTYPVKDGFGSNALGSVVGAELWGLEGAGAPPAGTFDDLARDVIPEIEIKVDSVAITAVSKKLKAKWTPEVGQDLNAFHNADAESELLSVLSEHMSLEIDQEILNDLVQGATAGTLYWSRSPGLFVDRTTGLEIGATSAAPDFTGTVSEWYETLLETINDVSARIHRKTLRGGANFIVCSPEVAAILEFTSGFRASVTVDQDGASTAGAEKVGSISKKFDVYVDPYFPRNVVLVGRKGSSFLESGYVYAPYVPLQATQTIYGPEDGVPRKIVMTRYGKKMVRPDMYGLVVVRGMLGESGGS